MNLKIPSKICVSINEPNAEECIKALTGIEFAEIRIDKMKNPNEEEVKKVFSAHKNLIATCRKNGIKDEERKKLLISAINSGAAFVDVEVEAPENYVKELVHHAKEKNCGVILSFHDQKKTPPKAELDEVIKWCFESGADIAKVACMVNSNKDNVRLLSLLDGEKPVVVIGMGEIGSITRIVGPILGSPFTFAKLGKGKETAPGQLEKEVLHRHLVNLGEKING
ncbi:type I 3-dehydroquinate dehydratase [Candidatus Micrarchaeota archaeon]|nr:type I 3-dehydroquinate dehydratase [Candidatus Micrarchaeota archaeon]